uniref:Uncharacterized protein n=1 Tax=Nicotiana tabacum TaxID=4097 RepID=A0A1S3Y1M8_TOBAC|nr:PREDICTED: uncharacterized protein LOC107771302 [Nicotiana tabacum]
MRDSDSQLALYTTSICNLEVQIGKISHALNTRAKGALPSDTVVNSKGGNNTGHVMTVITRSGRGENAPTSNKTNLVDDDKVIQEEEIPPNDVQIHDYVQIDIDDSVEETKEEVNLSREHIIDILEPVVQKTKAQLPKPPPLYPQSFGTNARLCKFMKDLVTKKRSINFETIKVTHQVNAIIHSMAPKLEDPGAFIIPCTIGSGDFAKALCDLWASINLIPYSVANGRLFYEEAIGVIEDVLVRVDKFIFPADFMILDCEVEYEVPIILGRPFPATGKALYDIEAGEITFWVGDKQVVFHVATINVGDRLEAILLNFDDDKMDSFMECMNSLQGMGYYNYAPQKLSLDLENKKNPPTKPSIEEPPTLELKPLPPHLRCEKSFAPANSASQAWTASEGNGPHLRARSYR